ncbi:unnamed protein product [Nippostrongylus brasiliensis]|uniref:Endo/exonuclease/phosphatase domain-containing protein n=1 Tax=Nippostrongylus brasiliensis TaxID=27835 RepID=A0A0N4YMX9_NIPBR|nr:unnamed protein product [Nippostrongylus brasiliensis]
MIVVAGDLNGHVGARKDGYECHGSFGYGPRNEDGERILEYACMHAHTNLSSRIRYSIDYVLVRRRDAKLVSDKTVVPYETEKEAEVIGGIQVPPIVDVDGTWQDMKIVVYEAARSQLGEKVRAKKRLYNVFLCNKRSANWSAYREARRAAKKAVAIAKAAHYDEVNRSLETRDGERLMYKLARTRQRQSEDAEKFHGVNDEHGQLLMDTKKDKKRWHDYFKKISTEEFPHPPLPQAEPIAGPILPISAEEVVLALRKMKPGKETGPDDVAAELCSMLFSCLLD